MKKNAYIALVALCLVAATVYGGGSPENGGETAAGVTHDEADPHAETATHTHDAAGGGASGDAGDHDHSSEIPHIEQIVPGSSEGLSVLATTNIVGDVLRNVAGDAADVGVLMAVGQNPHAYEPTPSALRRIESAQIVFTNGLGLESGLTDDLSEIAGGYVVPVSAGIDPLSSDEDSGEEHGNEAHSADTHEHGEVDPHVWMDPNNVLIWVRNMVDALSAADPDNREIYQENGDAYGEALREIDRHIRRSLGDIPKDRRKLVVDHESFRYFAEEYGLKIVGAVIPSTTDAAEPSARDMAKLVNLIREEDVRAVYVSRTASRSLVRLARSVADEVGHEVAIVPTLTGSLAPEGQPGDTYLGFLRYNVDQILKGLEQ
jgi:ABC-type Zn uptake system ZnuABC Zn-binding protein ZnuA